MEAADGVRYSMQSDALKPFLLASSFAFKDMKNGP